MGIARTATDGARTWVHREGMVLPRRTRPRHPDRTATNSNRKTSSPTYQVSQKAPSNFHQPAKRRGSDRGGRAEPTWYEIDGQCFFIVIGGGNLLQCKSASLTQRCRSKPSQGLNGHLGQYTGPQGGRKKSKKKVDGRIPDHRWGHVSRRPGRGLLLLLPRAAA